MSLINFKQIGIPDISHVPIQFKRQVYFEDCEVIVKPCVLDSFEYVENTACHVFFILLTKAQLQSILMSRVEYQNQVSYYSQVQIRFCRLGSSLDCDDELPEGLAIYVNSLFVRIDNNDRGIDITSCLVFEFGISNTIEIEWNIINDNYALTIVLAKRKMNLHGIATQSERTSLNFICEIAATMNPTELNQGISLKCPISGRKMCYPCRGLFCKHFECFDASTFLMIYEPYSEWFCPICSKRITFNDLYYDKKFLIAINAVGCNNVRFEADGNTVLLR